MVNGKPDIVILGSGNVATHMAMALDRNGHVSQIYSPDPLHAGQLAGQLSSATPVSNLNDLAANAHFYIIAIKDDAIAELVKHLPATNPEAIWAHTSGSVPAEVFRGYRENYGVFYPLQTFNKLTPVDFAKVPMLIEGNTPETAGQLLRLAQTISTNVKYAGSSDRKLFHLAAVFACNFANRMWTISDEILRTKGYDLTMLEPLLRMTLDNALKSHPADVQTGPARRHDTDIINSHIKQLPEQYAAIYRMISDNISKAYPHEQN